MADTTQLSAEAVARVQATFRLAFARRHHPELRQGENDARLNLAAAIIALDDAEGTAEVIAGQRHTLHEQAAVERALTAYGQALADLVRHEDAPSVTQRPLSRDPAHIREDLRTALNAALTVVHGDNLTSDMRSRAAAIVDGTDGYDQTRWCLEETLAQFGSKVFGALLLHNIESRNTLMGQSTSMSFPRMLAAHGLTVADLGWPNESIHPQYRS